jgi:hypothetical protein
MSMDSDSQFLLFSFYPPLANSLPGGYMKRDREGKGMLVVP